MSSILIKCMEIPKKGKTITITICSDGMVFEEWKKPHRFFKAIQVPDHGRLIDADALSKRIKEETINQAEFYADRYHPVVLAYGDCYEKVQNATTIIPTDVVPVPSQTEVDKNDLV